MSEKRVPAEAFPIGCLILEEMAARGWNMAHFCEVSGFSLEQADAIIDGREALTDLTALVLGLTFHVSAQFWRSLDDRYAEWRRRQDAEP